MVLLVTSLAAATVWDVSRMPRAITDGISRLMSNLQHEIEGAKARSSDDAGMAALPPGQPPEPRELLCTQHHAPACRMLMHACAQTPASSAHALPHARRPPRPRLHPQQSDLRARSYGAHVRRRSTSAWCSTKTGPRRPRRSRTRWSRRSSSSRCALACSLLPANFRETFMFHISIRKLGFDKISLKIGTKFG